MPCAEIETSLLSPQMACNFYGTLCKCVDEMAHKSTGLEWHIRRKMQEKRGLTLLNWSKLMPPLLLSMRRKMSRVSEPG